MRNAHKVLQGSHPCFGGQRGVTGRIHLPVSPDCNIACRFCDRVMNDTEDRPGVASKVISPRESLDVLEKALRLCPEITVAGIAGPGDTLASDYAFETFRLIKEKYPNLILCMSTNGLLLEEKAGELIDIGIDSLTVTVNAVDPGIGARLNRFILYHGMRYDGVKGAKILIENQIKGIRKISAAGITVKINTVLIPGINNEHIGSIAEKVKEAGADIYNIIPLIPQAHFKNCRVPGCEEIERARMDAEQYIDVFRHCRHCRADAVGVPGKSEYAGQIYRGRIQIRETFSHG